MTVSHDLVVSHKKTVLIQNRCQKSKECVKNSKTAKCKGPGIGVSFYGSLNFRGIQGDVAGWQTLHPSNVFDKNLLIFQKVKLQ